jgi:predicted ATPase
MATSSPRVAFQRTPFVAREHEMAQLTRALDEAQAGRGALVLLRGDAGIGKSRIADELVNHAQSAGFLALTGYCHEGDAAPAYAPFVQALEGVLTAMPAATLDDAVESAGLGVLQLLPKLAGGAEPYQVPAEMQRHHLFNSVNEFLAHLSQANPVLLVLEDLHWAAAPTVLLLRHLAESLGSGRLLIVGTHRPIELNTDASEEPPLGTLLEGLNKLSRAHSLEVGPLSQGGVAEIVSVFGGAGSPPALVRAICEQTEGNPFFVEEVVKHLAEEGRLQDSHGAWAPYATSEDLNVPESVRLVIGRRLTRMSEDCRKVLTAAGVIGRTFDYRLLAAVVDVDAERLLDSLDEAARARLITSGGSDYDTHLAFSHELIRQTLLLQVSLPRRQQLHLRVLSAIEERQSTGRAEFADLARHSLRAGPFADPETTIGYVMHAAERAMTATA